MRNSVLVSHPQGSCYVTRLTLASNSGSPASASQVLAPSYLAVLCLNLTFLFKFCLKIYFVCVAGVRTTEL